jgi:hypothetical protein
MELKKILVVAKEEATSREWEKIVREGKVIFSSEAPPAYDHPEILDKRKREVVLFRGKGYLAFKVSEAITREGKTINVCPGTYIERLPTGKYRKPKLKWVTDSVAQMTDEELEAIVANSK